MPNVIMSHRLRVRNRTTGEWDDIPAIGGGGSVSEYVTPQMYGATANGVDDDSDAIDEALNDEIHTVVFPDGDYVISRAISPRSNSILIFSANSTVQLLEGHTSQITNFITLEQVDNVRIYCNGSKFVSDSTLWSHIIAVNGSTNILIDTPDISGNASAKDGIYVYNRGETISKNIVIRGGKIHDVGRNGISFISVENALVENVEIYDIMTSSPRAGVDVEANEYVPNRYITIRNCYIHDNGGAGIDVTFGRDVLIENNRIINNALSNKAGASQILAGGTYLRTAIDHIDGQDKFVITSFDSDGWIYCEDVSGIDVLSSISFDAATGFAYPSYTTAGGTSDILGTTPYYYISQIDTSNNRFRITLKNGSDKDVITEFSDIPVIEDDSEDCWGLLQTEGISSNITVINNFIDFSYGAFGIRENALNTTLKNNKIYSHHDGVSSLITSGNYGTVIEGNKLYGTGYGSGISINSPYSRSVRNAIYNCAYGISVLGNYVELDGDMIIGCKTAVSVRYASDPHISNVVAVPGAYPCHGVVYTDSTGGYLHNCVIEGCLSDAGSRKGYLVEATTVIVDCVGFDGARISDRQNSKITDYAGYYTTDTVEGALAEIGAELAGINTLLGSGVIA